MPVKPAKPPAGLGITGAALWRDLARFWSDDDLEPDPRELRLLADACREADMLAALEECLAADLAVGGVKTKGSMGQDVANPLIGECRRSRAQVAALLKQLDLSDPDAEAKTGRGGRTTPWQARAAAMTRHHGKGA